MLASIIVTARDEAPRILDTTLDNLRATTNHLHTEVIVVDDGSATPIVPTSAFSAHGVRLLRNPQPLGVCESRRAGALLARGERLVWLDAHMSFGEGWLEQMLVQAQPGVVVCSPFWTYELDRCMCWGADFVWNATRDYQAGKYPGFALLHRTEKPKTAAVDVPMVIGACYAMHRETYDALGGFCPHFRVWGIDEQDLSARAWMAGMRVICAAHARVGHFTRQAFPYPVQFEHLEFNQAVMLRSVFEPATIKRLQRYFDPLPALVGSWLAATDLTEWRGTVQRKRKMTDAQFFARFLPELGVPPPAKAKMPSGKAKAAGTKAPAKPRAGKGRSA
jgi:glycosyltransferase involved in cell wall biosynthesis